MSNPLSITDIPTLHDLYRSSSLSAPSDPTTPFPPSSPLNASISLIRTSITTLSTTCIVNAANTSLLGGGGVDGAIHAASGPSLLAECCTLHGCPTGSAKITHAYELPCQYVIHAVGPIYHVARRERVGLEAELLRGCYRRSLELAAEAAERGEEGKGSVAFSCLSTGVYGYPATEAAEVAIKEVRRWLEGEGKGKLERVVFCVFEAKDERAYREWLPRVFPPAPEDSPERESTKGQGEGEDTKQEAVEESAVLVPQNEDGGEEPSPKKAKTEAQSQDTAAAKDEWEAVEKPHTPIPVEQAMDKSQEMSEEGEKVEPESLGDSDGEKVERPKEEEKGGFEIVDPMGKAEEEKAVGVNTLMKDW